MSAVDHEAAVAKLLADLGDTADAVADRLRALGSKGFKADACRCPVARYIETQSTYTGPAVAQDTTVVDDPDESCRAPEALTPGPVKEFICRFDRGVYLDLVEVA